MGTLAHDSGIVFTMKQLIRFAEAEGWVFAEDPHRKVEMPASSTKGDEAEKPTSVQ